MKEIINKIIEQYRKTGHINFYIVGKEGTGRSTLTHSILVKVCERLNIKPNIDMIDVVNTISSVKGINLIETFEDGDYNYKVKVLINYDDGQLKRGFYKFYSDNKKTNGRFKDIDIFKEEYYKKRNEIMEKNMFGGIE